MSTFLERATGPLEDMMASCFWLLGRRGFGGMFSLLLLLLAPCCVVWVLLSPRWLFLELLTLVVPRFGTQESSKQHLAASSDLRHPTPKTDQEDL